MHIQSKDIDTFDANIIIDNHMGYGENYQLLSIEDKSGKCICQILSAPHIDTEDVWERFSELFPTAYDFATVDTEHRDNAPLYIAE